MFESQAFNTFSYEFLQICFWNISKRMTSSESMDLASCLLKIIKVTFSYMVLVHFEVYLHEKDGLVHIQKDQNHCFCYQNPPHLHLPRSLHQNVHHYPLDHNAAELVLHQHHHYLHCRAPSQNDLLLFCRWYLPDAHDLHHLLMVLLLIKYDNKKIIRIIGRVLKIWLCHHIFKNHEISWWRCPLFRIHDLSSFKSENLNT